MELNRENLISCLSEIGYKLKGTYPNEFIFNHKGENTFIRVWGDNLESNIQEQNEIGLSGDYNFYAFFGKSEIEVMDNKNCVHIGSKGIFIHLYNFDNGK